MPRSFQAANGMSLLRRLLARRHAIPYARGRAPLGAPKPPATLLLSRSAAHYGQHESCEGDLRSTGRVLAKVTRAIPMEG